MTNNQIAIRDDMPLSELGAVLLKSGFFADVRDASQAIVKIMAGRELGLSPIAAMTGIYIVKGRVSLSANIMAAVLKRSGKYNYRVLEHTDKACEIAFFEGKEEVGRSRFTAEDAKRAGTQNMDKYPRNMLFARAMSNGIKWYAPDVTGGPIYTPEEMGAATDEDGEVIDQAPKPAEQPAYTDSQIGPDFDQPKPPAEPEAPTNGNGHSTRPYAPELLKKGIDTKAAKHAADTASQAQIGLTTGCLTLCFAGDEHAEEKRHTVQKYLAGVVSISEMSDAYVLAILDWLKPTKDTGGHYAPDAMAVREANLIVREAVKAAGQSEMALA